MSRLIRRVEKAHTLTVRWRRAIADHVIGLAWSPDGRTLAAAAVSGEIMLLNAADGALRHRLPGHEFGTMAISWRGDGQILASAGQDGKVRLWDVQSGVSTAEMAGGAMWVERVAWNRASGKTADQAILASAAGKVLRLWSPTGELRHEYRHDSTIQDIEWKPAGRDLVMAAYGGIAFVHPDKPDRVRQFKWQGAAWVCACSPNGKYVATGDQDATIHFWDARTGKDLQMWGYPTKVRELAWDSRSRYLATGGSATVVVWDCSGRGPEGSKPLQLEAHTDTLTALSFQHRGSLLASAARDGRVILWHPGQREMPVAGHQHNGAVSRIAWSPDDKQLISGDSEGEVVLCDVQG